MPDDRDKPRRAPTFGDRDERRDRRHRESAGISVPRGEFDPEDLTGRHEAGEIDAEQLQRMRATERPPENRIDRLERKHDRLLNDLVEVRAVPGRLDRLDRTLENLDKRLDADARRVVRAQAISEQARDLAQEATARSDETAQRIAATERIADGVEQLVKQLEGHRDRLGKLETDREVHSQRIRTVAEQQETHALEVRHRLAELEKTRAADTRELAVVRTSQRFWRRHIGKAIGAIAIAIAGAIGGVISHYLAPGEPPPPPHIGDH